MNLFGVSIQPVLQDSYIVYTNLDLIVNYECEIRNKNNSFFNNRLKRHKIVIHGIQNYMNGNGFACK